MEIPVSQAHRLKSLPAFFPAPRCRVSASQLAKTLRACVLSIRGETFLTCRPRLHRGQQRIWGDRSPLCLFNFCCCGSDSLQNFGYWTRLTNISESEFIREQQARVDKAHATFQVCFLGDHFPKSESEKAEIHCFANGSYFCSCTRGGLFNDGPFRAEQNRTK